MPKTKAKKNKPRIPTVDEFLQYKPVRAEYPWTTSEDGLVHITVPKFTGNLGQSLCRLVRKENKFTANLDRLGSFVWQRCDGSLTVKQILENVKEQFPDEKNIENRLYLYIQQMRTLNYIVY